MKYVLLRFFGGCPLTGRLQLLQLFKFKCINQEVFGGQRAAATSCKMVGVPGYVFYS